MDKTVREYIEEREELYFSPYASFSSRTRGRERPEEKCPVRPDYQRDRDRILHCKSFRRMKHKTQVFLEPEGDHYRTRLTHTLEVSQIARTIAKSLSLNEDLTEAIALGHDLGHTPFGHAGEAALNAVCSEGFTHVEQSLRVVEVLENKGQGLNLTWEVRDGIINHRTAGHPSTLEGKIVRLSDKIAYINHDIDDAIRGGILKESEVPSQFTDYLGHSVRERLNFLIKDVIFNSIDPSTGRSGPEIIMSLDTATAMKELRAWMFREVYANPVAKSEEKRAKRLLQDLFWYYIENFSSLPEEYQKLQERGDSAERIVCDYVSGMTDNFAISTYETLFVPKAWKRL